MQNGKEILKLKTGTCQVHYGNKFCRIYYQYILQENQFLLCRKKECYDAVAGMDMIKLVTRIIHISSDCGIKKDITDDPYEYKKMMQCLVSNLQSEQLNSIDDLLCAAHHMQSLNSHPLGINMINALRQ